MKKMIALASLSLSMAFASPASAANLDPFGILGGIFGSGDSSNSSHQNQSTAADQPLHGYNTRGPCKEIYQSEANQKLVYIHIDIEKKSLEMRMPPVEGNSETAIVTDVATANMHLAGAVETKRGCFQPHTLDKAHPSTEYPGAMMLDSVFFCGGEAIHVDPVSEGSHGCVHVDQAAADRIFDTVKHFGLANTAVCVD